MADISPNWNALYSNAAIRLTGNPALKSLQDGMVAQKKQKALDDQNYASQIAKLNFGGAKDADLDYLHKQYGGILNTFGQLRSTTDPTQRAQLQQKLAQDQNKFLFDIEHSKNANKQDLAGSHALLSAPDEKLQEGARDRWMKVTGTSSFDPTYQQTYQDAAQKTWADKPVDVVGETKKLADAYTKPLVKDDTVEKLKGGAFRVIGEKGVQTNFDGLKNAITQKAANDPHYLAGIVKTTGIADPKAALEQFVSATVEDAKKSNYMAKDIGSMQNKPDNFYAHLAARLASGDGSGQVGTPRDLTIPYKNGSAHVVAKGYVPINSAALNLAGSPAYDLTNGEKDPQVLSSGDHQLVGVTNVPFITGNFRERKNGVLGADLKGTIAQGDFPAQHPKDIQYRPMLHVQTKDAMSGEVEDKLVPYDRLPKNLPKATLKALGGFKQYSPSQTRTTQDYSNVTSAKDSKGNVISLGYKNGKWYDTKTHKPVQ